METDQQVLDNLTANEVLFDDPVEILRAAA